MYHIAVKLKNSKTYDECDLIKTKEEIIKEYVIPFLKNKDFFLGSKFVKKDDIEEILIKESDYTVKEIVCHIRQKNPGIIMLNSIYTFLENNISGKNIMRDLIKEIPVEKEAKMEVKSNNKVFIVHGHDKEMEANVARFVEKLGLKAVILHEETSGGDTIIEKIEKHTDVGYGIVLYSPCDKGKGKAEKTLKNRARQNVVFEHGYLMGKLGRDRVIALNKNNVEVPSDITGIVYVPFDNHCGWQMTIAKEMKNKGFEIDLNRL